MSALAPYFGPLGDVRVFAGEALAIEISVEDDGGVAVDLTGRTFVMTAYANRDRSVFQSASGIAAGDSLSLSFAGDQTEELYEAARAGSIRLEIVELLLEGVDVFAEGSLSVVKRAAGIVAEAGQLPLTGGNGQVIVRGTRKQVISSMRGAPGLSAARQLQIAGVIGEATPEALDEYLRLQGVLAVGPLAAQAADDRVHTGQDRVATGQDRTAVHTDALGTAGDRVQTGLDRTATAGDRVQTGQDRVATGQDRTAVHTDALTTAGDRVQTGLDRTATTGDRVQTGLDRIQTGADRDAAAVARARVETIANTGVGRVAANWAALTAIVGAANDGAIVVDTDTGTHADPVSAATVSNAGVFRYSASPAGWTRVSDSTAAQVAAIYQLVAVAAANGTASAAFAAGVLTGYNAVTITQQEGVYPLIVGDSAAALGAIRSSGVGISRDLTIVGVGMRVATTGPVSIGVGSLVGGSFGAERVFTLNPTTVGDVVMMFADNGIAPFVATAGMVPVWRSTTGGGTIRLTTTLGTGLTSSAALVQGTPAALSSSSSSRPVLYLIGAYQTFDQVKTDLANKQTQIDALAPTSLALPGGPASATINPQGQLVPGNDPLGAWATNVPLDDGTAGDRQRYNDAVLFLRSAIVPKDAAAGFKSGYSNGSASTVRQPVTCWINDNLYFACWEARDGAGGDGDASTVEAAWCVNGVWQPQFVLVSDTSQQLNGTTAKNLCSNLSVAYDEGLNELRVPFRERRRDYANGGSSTYFDTADGTPFYGIYEVVTTSPGPGAVWTGKNGAVLTLPASRPQLVDASYLLPAASVDPERYICPGNTRGVYKKIGAGAGSLWLPFRTRRVGDLGNVSLRLGRFDRTLNQWVLGGYTPVYSGSIGPGECTMEELPDGKWLLVSRTNTGGNRLCYIFTADGATCLDYWYDTTDLYGQEMTGSLLRLSGPPSVDGQPYRLLFSANLNTDGASSASRGGLGVRICYGVDPTTGRPIWSKRVQKLFPYNPTIVFQSLSGTAIATGSPVTNASSATCLCRTGPLSFAVACDKEMYAIGSSGMFNAVGWISLSLGSLFLRLDGTPGDIPPTDNTATLATVRSAAPFKNPLAAPAVWDSASYPVAARRGIALAGSVGYTALAVASIAALAHAGRFGELPAGDTLLLTPELVTMADATNAERLFSIAPKPCFIVPQNTNRVPVAAAGGVAVLNWAGAPTATFYRGYLPRDFAGGDPSASSALSMFGTVQFTADATTAYQTVFRLMNGSDVFLSVGRDQSGAGSFWRCNVSRTPGSTSTVLTGAVGGGECVVGTWYWWYLELDRASDSATLWAGTAGQTIGDATKRAFSTAVFGNTTPFAWGVDCTIQVGGKATTGTIRTSCLTRTLGMRPELRTLAQKQDRVARMLLANPQIV